MTLTTNHAASSYGIPVLVDESGTTYGQDDIISTGETAREFVRRMNRGGAKVQQHTDGRAPEIVERLEDESQDPLDLLTTGKFAEQFARSVSLSHAPVSRQGRMASGGVGVNQAADINRALLTAAHQLEDQ